MTLLDWLVVATVAAIILVLLDGLRRKWVERRNRVVMKLDRNLPQEDIDLDLLPNSELPNGGARTLTRDADPSPNTRKRNIKLKDGRDQRGNDPASPAYVPPVLMDHVEVEEESIEHANVYVKAEEPVNSDDAFGDEDLPPEVLAGLDSEFDDDASVKAAAASADEEDEESEDDLDDELHQESLEDDDDGDDVDDEGLLDPDEEEPFEDDEDEDEFGDEDEERFEPEQDEEVERFEADIDDDEELADLTGDDYEPVARGKQLADDEEDSAEADEGEEYPDEYEDEYADDYENEPTLLEGAYRKAASHFQRPQEPEVPRVEPGFGEAPAGEVESDESFASAFDEQLMDEILDQEQAEIRAWRTQSVTQQNTPEPEPAAEKRKPPVKPAAESPAPKTPQNFFPPVPHVNELDDEVDELSDEFLDDEDENDVAPVMSETPPADKPRPAVKTREKTREPKKGFWEAVAGKVAAKAPPKPTAKLNQGELFQEDRVEEPEPVEEPTGPQEVIIINVMAKNGSYFRGDDLLPLVQRYGMRLGNMSIFHRHADHTGTGPVMFSMANMVKPGTFSLNSVEEFVTPGISFFVQLPNKFGNMKSFDQMLATAEGIKQALDGDLKDERRSVFTRQTVEHCRQRIRDFELSLLAKK